MRKNLGVKSHDEIRAHIAIEERRRLAVVAGVGGPVARMEP
jgi:hypothetical protein